MSECRNCEELSKEIKTLEEGIMSGIKKENVLIAENNEFKERIKELTVKDVMCRLEDLEEEPKEFSETQKNVVKSIYKKYRWQTNPEDKLNGVRERNR